MTFPDTHAPGDEAEKEALGNSKNAFLLVWIVLGYPRNADGFYMTLLSIERLMRKLSFLDLLDHTRAHGYRPLCSPMALRYAARLKREGRRVILLKPTE